MEKKPLTEGTIKSGQKGLTKPDTNTNVRPIKPPPPPKPQKQHPNPKE